MRNNSTKDRPINILLDQENKIIYLDPKAVFYKNICRIIELNEFKNEIKVLGEDPIEVNNKDFWIKYGSIIANLANKH